MAPRLDDVDRLEVFRCPVSSHDGAMCLSPQGALDAITAPLLEHAVLELLEQGCHRVVIDLRGVVRADRAAVQLALRMDAAARRAGAELALRPGPPPVDRAFRAVGLHLRLRFDASGDLP
jgi:anti-anti-sigma factor